MHIHLDKILIKIYLEDRVIYFITKVSSSEVCRYHPIMHIMIAFVSSFLVLILMQGNHHGTVSAFTFTTAPTTTTTTATATTSTSTRKRFSFAVGVHSKEFGRKQAAAPDPTSRITRTNTEHNLPYAYGQSSIRTPSPTTIDERNPGVVQKERDQAQAQYRPQTSVPPNLPSTNTNADININNNKNINDIKNMNNNLKNSIKNSMNNSMNNNSMNNNSMNNNSMNNNSMNNNRMNNNSMDNNNIDTNIQSKTERVAEAKRVVLSFISALYDEPKGFSGKMDMSTKNNDNKVQTEYNIMDYFQETVEVTDTSYHKSIIGKHALIQHLQQRPKSVFYINNELPSMQVLSVTVGSSAGQIGGTTDVKVAVLYQYWTNGEEDDKGKGKGKVPNDEGSDAEVGEDWDKQSGITFYTVSDGLISNVFDVKEGSKLDTSKLKAEKFDPKKVANLQMVKETSEDLNLNLNPYANLPMAFLEARNQRNLDDMMDMMADDCWAKGITMDDTLSRSKKVYALRLGQLTEGITFVTEEIVASMSSPGDLEVAVRWTMCLEDQQQTYHRGCTYFTVEDGLITSVMDILESSKQDEPPSRPGGFSVSRQNWLRDSGIAADLFDTLQASSFPSILKEHSKSGNGSPEFAKLSLGRKKIKYGKHSSQFVDMFLPPDMDNRRGLVFFVVRVLLKYNIEFCVRFCNIVTFYEYHSDLTVLYFHFKFS